MESEFPFLVGGEWRKSDQCVEIRSPYNGEVAGRTFSAAPGDAEAAMESAEAAFQQNRRMPVFRRAEILQRIVEALQREKEAIARLIALEAGKPIKWARAEASRAAVTFTDALEECKRIRGEWLPLDLDASSEGRFAVVRRFPIGPVLAITPFNFPLNLAAHKVAPALACGNTMVLKPAPQAPLSSLHLARIVLEAGAPPGMLNAMLCPVPVAQTLVRDDRLKMLTFTGSAAVGWALKQSAGKKRVVLELGGNAGVAVHSDADIAHAAQRCAFGSFAYAGQICIAVQRIYVHQRVLDEFLSRFLELVRRLKTGDPLAEDTDLGPMISREAAERAERWIRDAQRGGAKLLAGGGRDGSLLEPTVLTNTQPHMLICREEAFAPVAVVEPYEDFRDAIAAINDSSYGLQAGIFTRDAAAIFHAFEHLEVGAVMVNEVPTYRADPMPYGGTKDSGIGREGVRYAIEEMTERKVLVLTSPADLPPTRG
jgi:glyceraldehyde-3-phosphate dehydrogenase (NADP+)